MKQPHAASDPQEIFGATPNVTLTGDVEIKVWPIFDEQRSQASPGYFYYRYHIKITNRSQQSVQVLRRHWEIRDAFNHLEEVDGEGIVGQQPLLHPGESFSYASFCPLRTPTGEMRGKFQLRRSDLSFFDANIDTFFLTHAQLLN